VAGTKPIRFLAPFFVPSDLQTMRTAWVVETLILLLGCCGCERSPNMRDYTSQAGLKFVGDKTSGGGTTYFGVRLSKKSVNEQPAWASVRLKIGDKQLGFGSITPKDIIDLGGSVVPSSIGISDDTTHAGISWGEQNRDGGIELKFRDNSLVDGWLHWHKAQPSPFSVSSKSGDWITFPVNEASLGKSFGPPESVRDFRTK
jgi:hypothetical protein